jgi:[ribosomal protein S5]-alanine N-acetyltransferase
MNFGNLSIETHRFLLRPLVIADASQEYLSWMRDDVAAQYIVAAASTQSLESLERYILEKTTKTDCLFLGIFDKNTGSHIGNIKYEPIFFEDKVAVMGVLLGDVSWRGEMFLLKYFLLVRSGCQIHIL